MYTEDLYDNLLIAPLNFHNFNRLVIVSGYATAAMSFRHLRDLQEKNREVKIQLIVGMTPKDGINLGNHNGFVKLAEQEFADYFSCRYVVNDVPVHSKLYVWCMDDKPQLAFIGSANYTQTALCSNNQREVMDICDHNSGYDYFEEINARSIFCNHPEVDQSVLISRDNIRPIKFRVRDEKYDPKDYSNLPSVRTSLLSRGELPQRSGLNWGQRPGRDPNQAYIRLDSSIYNSDFFPAISSHFTLLTDDGKTLICTIAQQRGKAIHTPYNNSLLGEYFRNRLGVRQGQTISTRDLLRYGRTDIVFCKIDEETYYMDFSAPQT